jgi:hypothetical protein
MRQLVAADGKPADYAGFIKDRFSTREVVEIDKPLLALALPAVPGAVQDRRACCGTINLLEYYNAEAVLAQAVNALAQWCRDHGRTGPAG